MINFTTNKSIQFINEFNEIIIFNIYYEKILSITLIIDGIKDKNLFIKYLKYCIDNGRCNFEINDYYGKILLYSYENGFKKISIDFIVNDITTDYSNFKKR